MERAVICADIGTSSLKAALIDEHGVVLSYIRIRFADGTSGKTGESWYQAFCRAAGKLYNDSTLRTKPVLTGICISGNGPTITAPSGETLLWNAPVPEEKKQRIRARLSADICTPSLFLPRLVLFQEYFPEIWDASPVVFSGPEYLIWRISGTAVTILPEKRYTGAYWTPESAAAAGIDSNKLPEFVSPGFCAGTVTPAAADDTGIPADTPVYCGAPDFIAALIGTGTLVPGTICDRAGSSEGINLCLPGHPGSFLTDPALLEGIRILPSVIPGLYNAGVLIPDSGIKFSRVKKQVAPDLSYTGFVERILEQPELYPEVAYLMETTAVAVAGGFKKLVRLILQAGMPVPRIICATGGQAQNPLWTQYKADVLGIPIEVTASPDAELTGDAIMAFTGAGLFESFRQGAEALISINRVYEPRNIYGSNNERV